MKAPTLLSLTFLFLLFLTMACSRADQCPAETTYGPYYLTGESKAYLPPFQSGDTLVFRNEAAEELAFFALHPPVSGVDVLYAWYAPCGRGGDEVRVELMVEHSELQYFALGDYFLSFGQRVAYTGPSCPPTADINDLRFFDLLQAQVRQPLPDDPVQQELSYLRFITSDRGHDPAVASDKPSGAKYAHYLSALTFRGQTYQDVYANADETFFLSRDYRLVAFQDHQGEWWWLHHTISPEETDN